LQAPPLIAISAFIVGLARHASARPQSERHYSQQGKGTIKADQYYPFALHVPLESGVKNLHHTIGSSVFSLEYNAGSFLTISCVSNIIEFTSFRKKN
jgi:hypothetical protein